MREYPSRRPYQCPWYEDMGGNLNGVYVRDRCTDLPQPKKNLPKGTKVYSAGNWDRVYASNIKEWEREKAAYDRDELR